ncbi:Integrase catalytic domain-containing protein, partial [Durusdinium trenchii]
MAAVSAGTTCYGMLDSGATCSAGPEQSIKRLAQAVLTKDSAAQIKVDGQNRPRFRYGSGKWGRAQYHLEIKSSTSARTFQAFALPDPEEITQPWFQDHMLVPVLVGMDFMKGNGMIVDFSDGLAVCAALDEDEPVQLPRNGKSHYMIDLVHFITGGKTNYVGSPTVQATEIKDMDWDRTVRSSLEYVPKIGAPANSSLVNPGNVKKVIAEERMKTLLAEYQKSWDSAKSKVNKAKEEPDYLQYLNEDEKMRLMDLVHQRDQQQAQQAPLPNDMDPENMDPNYEAAMNLIHMLNEDFKKNLAELVYDGKKPYVWEMFCSPNSTITHRCEREGLNGVRIGLSTGFDLYKDQTYEDLKTVFKKQKPKKIWVSPMCTYFCDWVDLNYWYRFQQILFQVMIHYDLLKNWLMILMENNLMLPFKVTEPLFVYQHGEVKVENSEMCIKAITMRWLLDKPRPKVLCPDNAKSLTSQQFVDFFGSVGIQVIHPPDREPWAHGVAENATNLVKTTASKLQFSMPDQDPALTLASATSAINNTEFNKGFTSFQWAFGRQASAGGGELRRQLMSPLDRNETEPAKLLNQRQLAEDRARKQPWSSPSPRTAPSAYTDVTGEEPKQEETLEPYLPKQPNEETYLPKEIDCGYVMEFELNFTSNRQRKMFMRNPQAYLVKKVSGAEVCYRKLNAEDRKLFDNAKASEVSSFIRSEAVRRCLSVSEQNKAKDSQRILKARWVLVWKPEINKAYKWGTVKTQEYRHT